MLSTLHCITQEDDLHQQWPVCGFSIALLRYLQTWWRKKQQISLFAQVDHRIFFFLSGSLDIFGQPYQARRAGEKLYYKCQPTLAALAQHGMSEAIELWKCCKTIISSNASLGKMYHPLIFLLSDQNVSFQNIWQKAFHSLCQFVALILILKKQKGVNSFWRQPIDNWQLAQFIAGEQVFIQVLWDSKFCANC